MWAWIVFAVVAVVLGVLAISESLRPQSFSPRKRGPWYFDGHRRGR